MELMIEHSVGVRLNRAIEFKKIDEDLTYSRIFGLLINCETGAPDSDGAMRLAGSRKSRWLRSSGRRIASRWR